MRIGVLLDSGAFQWTTINGAPSGAVVTLTATLTGAASSGARVFAYTSKPLRPFVIETAVLRDTQGDDVPIDFMTLEEYEAIPSKSDTGTIGAVYFEAKRTNASLYLDCQPDNLTEVVRFVYLSYVEDLDGTTQDVDFPAEWFRPLSAQLAIDCAPAFRQPVTQELRMAAQEALAIAKNAYPEKIEGGYRNDPDCY